MENSLRIKEEAWCECKKLKQSQEEWQKNCWNWEGLAPASSSCYKFEIKIGSMVDLNHGLSCQTAR